MPREGTEREPRADGDEREHEPDRGRGAGAEAAESRGGQDVRRRGWFWHWNTIITQYAPLIGLKGVGLLNSYTVWTDRREESPWRGYAFPSQQSEADFYGEDRAELITINKVLVALDLIEIRKQMVQRVDERGRRWRVPHNLYRVKDHPDGYCLTPEDVLRVVTLAARDRAVYRYVRRIFSSRFSPIDADNVWHQILPVVRQHPAWQQLARRAQAEEAKASARTRAGHARRAQEQDQEQRGEPAAGQGPVAEPGAGGEAGRAGQAAIGPGGQSRRKGDSLERVSEEGLTEAAQTSVAGGNDARGMGVASGNNGSATVADACDEGSVPLSPTIAERSNKDRGDSVGQTNRTYHESPTTTTTTFDRSDAGLVPPPATDDDGAGTPLSQPAPVSLAAAISCFEAANGRAATPLECDLLGELARSFDPSARRAGADGPAWVVDAIREAVSSGSRFVAPKRIREILGRWSQAEPDAGSAARESRRSQLQLQGDQLRPGGAAGSASGPSGVADAVSVGPVLPNGRPAAEVWSATLRLLGGALERGEHERLFAGSRVVGYRAGTVSVAVGSAAAAERLSGEYYDLVSRKLAQALRRPVRLVFEFDSGSDAEHEIGPGVPAAMEREAERLPVESRQAAMPAHSPGSAMSPARGTEPPELPSFTLPGGLSNRQLWAAAQDELARRLSPASWESWVRPAVLLATAGDALVLGVPTAFAQRRLATHLRIDVEAVLSELLGRLVGIEVVVTSDWLRSRAGQVSGAEVVKEAD